MSNVLIMCLRKEHIFLQNGFILQKVEEMKKPNHPQKMAGVLNWILMGVKVNDLKTVQSMTKYIWNLYDLLESIHSLI